LDTEEIFNKLHLADYHRNKIFSGCVNGRDIKASLDNDAKQNLLSIASPIDGSKIAEFNCASIEDVNDTVAKARESFQFWQSVPAPKRGELVRLIALVARERKEALAALITLEMGKTVQESLGEVQEWIDIAEFAVGLSRQLYGLSIVTERPQHRMMEQWHPLGPVGVITAFNFPMAVWAWNAMLGLVCGDPIIWKPSEKTPLCALACHQVVMEALMRSEFKNKLEAEYLSHVLVGEKDIGQSLTGNIDVPLISATGSVPMGKSVAQTVGARLGRHLLELGGNNAMIVSSSSDLLLAIRAIVFSAVGTTGQRCTSLRRLVVHKSMYKLVCEKVAEAYQQISIGDPRDEKNLIGPLIDEAAFEKMNSAIEQAIKQGGQVISGGGKIPVKGVEGGVYVKPCLIKINLDAPVVKEETFAPILYIDEYTDLKEAIYKHNNVPQGLSSAIFTESIKEAEIFLSPEGSDCGIANVNIGTSGAEIGGAFGGEKETGGGRESGSDAWKNYMRRTTNTINYGKELPLAQGIKFDI